MTDPGKPFKQTYAGALTSYKGKEILQANEDKEKLSTSAQSGEEILKANEHREKLSTSIELVTKAAKTGESLDDVTIDQLKILQRVLSHVLKQNKKLQNPQNWPPEKIISLYCEVSNRLDDPWVYRDLLTALEEMEVNRIGRGERYEKPLQQWDERIDTNLLKEMTAASNYKYNFKSVRSLVRFIRNLNSHHGKLPSHIQPSVMPYEHLDGYIKNQFPGLLAAVYKAVSETCKEKDCFGRYFD